MKKALFELEFKRIFLGTLALLLAIRGSLLLIEQLRAFLRPDLPRASSEFDIIAFVVLIFTGYFSGRATFSPEFKQRYVLFLEALPVSRRWLWLILFLANLSAALLSVCLALVLRPSIVVSESISKAGLAGLFLYLLLFCAGSCYSLLFRNVPLEYIVGLVGTLAALAVSVLLMFGFISDPRNGRQSWMPQARDAQPDLVYLFFCAGVLLALYLFLSYRFFVKGETYMLKVRAKNAAFLFASHIVVFAALAVAQDSHAFTRSHRMSSPPRFPLDLFLGDIAVSPSGDYLAVVERSNNHPQFAQINVVEVRTGKLSARVALRGARRPGWSSDNNLIVELADDAPLARLGYLLPPSDSLLWFSPDGREIGRTRFGHSRILEEFLGSEGRIFVITKHGPLGTINTVDETTRKIDELASAEFDGPLDVQRHRDRVLVFFVNLVAPPKAWTLTSQIRELPWVRSKTEEIVYVFNGMVYSSQRDLQDQVAKLYPFAQMSQDNSISKIFRDLKIRNSILLGGYILPGQRFNFPRRYAANYFDDSMSLFYFQASRENRLGELWAFDKTKKSWVYLTGGIPASPTGRRYMPALDVAPSDGLAVYCVSKNTGVEAYLYDANIGARLSLGSIEMGESTVRLDKVGSSKLFFVKVVPIAQVKNQGSGSISQERNFTYVPGSGALKSLTKAIRIYDDAFYVDGSGNAIFSTQQGIVWASVTGEQRQLWPQAKEPGQ